jgi:hypothetical protein
MSYSKLVSTLGPSAKPGGVPHKQERNVSQATLGTNYHCRSVPSVTLPQYLLDIQGGSQKSQSPRPALRGGPTNHRDVAHTPQLPGRLGSLLVNRKTNLTCHHCPNSRLSVQGHRSLDPRFDEPVQGPGEVDGATRGNLYVFI